MLLPFDEASDAVGYALAYQQALSQFGPPLRARAGLHVGPVTLRENSRSDIALGAKPIEVEGVAKATAARVMSAALGGQILLSADARQTLSADRLRLQSHGHWRLKGLDDPIELFEVGDDHAPFVPPPDSDKAYRVARQGEMWLPVREIRHSLPAEGDAFVGRTEALSELARQIQSGARLVSVLGIGGTGKTRLVMRYGRSWLGEFPGGVWFCDLASARSVDGIASAVAQGLGVPLGRDDPVVQLGHAIAGRGPCLVILDNFEQVARHAAQTLGHWLGRADQARFVVTTREVLGLVGEVVLALSPLAPAEGAELFVQRAMAAKPDFQLHVDDPAAIAQLVVLLDGLPLAIELAAARVRVMPPRMLLTRMSERFKLLVSKGGRLDRQSTLRAAFDWSWDLLPPPEKAALAQLSVFEGGFTLEAAEAVIDLSASDDAPWTVDVVHALVDKSFVRPRSDDRFDLLVSAQLYAAEHLQTEGRYGGSGPSAMAAAQERHGAWYAAFSEQDAAEVRGADLDNLVVACRRAILRGDVTLVVSALEGAWAALRLRGPFGVGAELALDAGSMPDLMPAAIARIERIAGMALQATGRVAEAQAHLEVALHAAREAPDRRAEAQMLGALGEVYLKMGRVGEAGGHLALGLTLAREIADRTIECEVLNSTASLNNITGRQDEARSDLEAALRLARDMGDRRWEAGLLGNLGTINLSEGKPDQAREYLAAGLAASREIGDRKWEGNALCNLGCVHIELGQMLEARDQLCAALEIARELGYVWLEGIARRYLGTALVHLADHDEAMAQFEAAVRIARALDDRLSQGQALGHLGLLHARQGRHDEARRCLELGEALLGEASDPLSLGVLRCSRSEAHHLVGDAAAAAASFEAAAAIGAEVGVDPASELGLALERVRALINLARA